MVRKLWPTCPNELAQSDTVLVVRAGYAMERGRLPASQEFGVRPLSKTTLEQLAGGQGVVVIERSRASPPAAVVLAG